MLHEKKILKRLTKTEVNNPDPEARNQKLHDALANHLELNIQQIRLVNDSENWRGWVVSYDED
jgi:hypothetical protein